MAPILPISVSLSTSVLEVIARLHLLAEWGGVGLKSYASEIAWYYSFFCSMYRIVHNLFLGVICNSFAIVTRPPFVD
jgi:hypothetical protein